MKYQQRGMALITVLFTVALLTLLAGQLHTRFQADLERTFWLQREGQAREYALGGEQFARQLLWQDRQELILASSHRSPLPRPPVRFRPPHGTISLQTIDLQGRINLNNLLDRDGKSRLTERYLQDILGMPELEPLLTDWIDRDSTPLPGGAEDATYEWLGQPFRTPNQSMADASEMVPPGNMTHKDFFEHAVMLTALPISTALNINTMPEELVVVLHPELSPTQFRRDRATAGGSFENLDNFLTTSATAGIEVDTGLITVDSAFFAIHSYSQFDGHDYRLVSRLWQDPATGDLKLMDRTIFLGSDSEFNTVEYGDDDRVDPVF